MNKNSAVIYDSNSAGIASITMNRPEKHNAFDDTVIAALTEAFNLASEDKNVRAVVLQANGKSFCAGADLGWMKKMAGYSEQENRADAAKLAQMLHTLYHLPKLTIAKVQGAAFGGAIGLVACCDVAVGTKLSKFCLSEVKLGLIPATISPYVVEAMGARVCKRYFQTAEVFSARRARRLGLLSEVVAEEDLDNTVAQIATSVLPNGPCAVSDAKQLVDHVKNRSCDPQLMQETSDWIARVRVSDEGQEGLQAFFDKRRPSWREQEQ